MFSFLKDVYKFFSLLGDKDFSRNEEFFRLFFDKVPDPATNFLKEISYEKLVAVDTCSPAHVASPRLRESPNKNADIAFVIQQPFQYYIYKNVYKHLASRAEFVIESYQIRENVKDWFSLFQRIASFLEKAGVCFRFFPYGDPKPEFFFGQYKTLVSHCQIGALHLPANQYKKKVRMMYGQSKDAYDFGPWLRHFNLALTYGEYSDTYTRNFTRSEIVGNPKFDDWFSGTVDNASVKDALDKLDPKKKTILYLPTHGDLSSLEWVSPAIPRLLKSYNVIIKPHHLTLYNEPGRAALLSSFAAEGAIMVDDFADILPLFRISDTVLLDNSGAIFDALLADKPLVLIDFLDTSFFREKQWQIKKYGPLGWIFPLSYEGSLEQRVKKEKEMQIGRIVSHIDELESAVADSLKEEKGQAYETARKKLQDMLFSFQDGWGSARAAESIKKLTDSDEGVREKRTFFSISADVDGVKHSTIKDEEKLYLWKVLSAYVNPAPLLEPKNIFSQIEFSIVLPTRNRAQWLSSALGALDLQEGIEYAHWELIVIDDCSIDETRAVVDEFITNHPLLLIRYVGLKENSGPAVARNIGISLARGRFVCFTDDDATVGRDWIRNIEIAFLENPELGGVGGWRIPTPDSQTLFAKFIFYNDLRWLPYKSKGVNFFSNMVGDTASVCYRKSVLEVVGGFSHFFRLPGSTCLEDWEIKVRVAKAGFSLLYSPTMLVRHHHPDSLKSFIRHFLIRGWAYQLLMRFYPGIFKDYNYNYSLWLAWRMVLSHLEHSSVLPENRFKRVGLFLLSIIQSLTILWGKYYWALILLRNKHRPRFNKYCG